MSIRHITIRWGLVAALFACPVIASAVPITTLFNTGVDAAKNTLANNTTETHYSLISSPAGAVTGLRTVTAANGFPVGPWIGDDALSDWIGPASDSQVDGPVGTYTYRTTFSLAGFNPLTASITGLWATDDAGLNIILNGVATGLTTSGGFTAFTAFSITSGFVSGINTLDFVVLNGGGPTGLRAELAGNAARVPEPGTGALLALGLLGLAVSARRKKAKAL